MKNLFSKVAVLGIITMVLTMTVTPQLTWADAGAEAVTDSVMIPYSFIPPQNVLLPNCCRKKKTRSVIGARH